MRKLEPTDDQKGRIIDLVVNQGLSITAAGRVVFPEYHRTTSIKHAKLILGEWILERESK